METKVKSIDEKLSEPSPVKWHVIKKRILKRAKELRPGHPFTRVDPRLRVEGGYFDMAINRAIDELVRSQPSVGKTIK